jgi:hypothetical protein
MEYTMISVIYLALQLIHPNTPNALMNSYAAIIDKQATIADVDPLAFVAIIEHESQWRPRAISPDGEDFGLMQVRGRYYGGKAEWLLNPEVNIRAGGYIIKKSKEFCRNYLHREPEYQEWMACYQGSCVPGHVCKPTKLTKVVQDYQTCLEDELLSGQDSSKCHKIYEGKQYE